MSAGFTKGPWVVEHGVEDSEGEMYVCHAGTVCDVTAVCTIRDENEANARLIAAAPELYEALQAYVDHISPHLSKAVEAGYDNTPHTALMNKAQATLAKARGEA